MSLLLWQRLNNYKQNLIQQTWTFHVEFLHKRKRFSSFFFLRIKCALHIFWRLLPRFYQASFYFIALNLYRWSLLLKKKVQETIQDSLVSKSSSWRSTFCRIARARYAIEPPFPPLSNMRKSFLDYKMNIKISRSI